MVNSEARKISPALFGIALVCFFLPFVSVSCQGQKFGSFTGVQLAVGTTVEQPGLFGQTQSRKVDGEPLALLALLCGVLGLLLCFSQRVLSPALAAGGGIVLLFMLKTKLDGDVARQAGGILRVDYDVGFWASLLLYAAAAAVNAYLHFQGGTAQRSVPRFESSSGVAPPAVPLRQAAFASGGQPFTTPQAPPHPRATAFEPLSATTVVSEEPTVFGRIVCTGGEHLGSVFSIGREGLLIGRDPGRCQIVLNSDLVSREHARIFPQDGGILIIDNGSSNGTFINSTETARIEKSRLDNGDTIFIGRKKVAAFTFQGS